MVDIDLEKFFDRVNHDVLLARVARKVSDARVLKLIRRFLEAGMMQRGVIEPRREGTPQGGPLSPLLSNILLDDLDRELERRGLAFCRYADDCNVYVGSRVAGERVMRGLRVFLEEVLRLRINAAKSAVARPWERTFLGYMSRRSARARLRIAPQSVQRLTQRVREHAARRARPIAARTPSRHSTRCCGAGSITSSSPQAKACWRSSTVAAASAALSAVAAVEAAADPRASTACVGAGRGARSRSAGNGHGPWWNAGASHLNQALAGGLLHAHGAGLAAG